ncbi:MAG TPA: neutral/alkaline non-lysosomal ceramidase N-terminal domain-containing protein [Nevskiaceae bacterium]|nr:neutral/alkaline non-lysosomal ceramidase N-terminal domain-containing protein [Nevskiaceae bacterium]
MFRAGWSKAEIHLTPHNYAMHGFGVWRHRATGQQSPLNARAFWIGSGSGKALIFCCLDLGYITLAMRDGVCARLAAVTALDFDPERLVLTCTHTHSGPGGCAHDVLYNIVTPGYVPEHVEAIVAAAVQAITGAHAAAAETRLVLRSPRFKDAVTVAWNRSLAAYNRNPDVTHLPATETHLALDREMQLLCFEREGCTQALLSLFGVHATCCGNTLHKYASDNKGAAAMQAERALAAQGVTAPVAIFAQATAGDVSPWYHGPGEAQRRAHVKGDAHYAYAASNGGLQAELALGHVQDDGREIDGAIDAVFSYVDFTHIHAEPRFANGEPTAWTSVACHGAAFFMGTPVDGRGAPPWIGSIFRGLAGRVRRRRLLHGSLAMRAHYEALYAAQGVKDVVLEDGPGRNGKRALGWPLARIVVPGFLDPTIGEMKRQARSGAINESALVPSVLPLQIVTLGELVLVCCPGEFTTTAGARIKAAVRDALAAPQRSVLLCTYCNDYMGYVTTREEYQQQAYEGGHTVFGQWELAAFQTRLSALAAQLDRPPANRDYDRSLRPVPTPPEELALRTHLEAPKARN